MSSYFSVGREICGDDDDHKGSAQEMHTFEASILIANMPKSFILSQFNLAYSS